MLCTQTRGKQQNCTYLLQIDDFSLDNETTVCYYVAVVSNTAYKLYGIAKE